MAAAYTGVLAWVLAPEWARKVPSWRLVGSIICGVLWPLSLLFHIAEAEEKGWRSEAVS